MARYTPTNTPIRNYAIAFFLSVFFLYADISSQTFAPLRGIINASSLYVQDFSKSLVENISFTFSSFKQNKYLLQENKKLREQTLQIGLRDFIEKKDNEEVKKFCEVNFNINFPLSVITEVKGDNAHEIYKWAKKNYGKSAVPKWNFYKILINKEGKIEDTFASFTKPMSGLSLIHI